MEAFWDSLTGKILRWIAVVPALWIGLGIAGWIIAESFHYMRMAAGWKLGDMSALWIVGVIVVGPMVLGVLLAALLWSVAGLA